MQVEADLWFGTGSGLMQMDSTGHWTDEYRFEFWREGSPSYPNRFDFGRYRGGGYTGLADQQSPVPITTPSRVVVRREGSTLVVTINGIEVSRVTDPAPLPAGGRAGLGVIWAWTDAFDNFVVRACE